MKKTSKRLVGTLAAASSIASFAAPAAQVFAAEQVNHDWLAAKLAEAKQTKRFGNYNEAKVAIYQLPVAEQTKWLLQLVELDKDVFTDLNKSYIAKLNAFAADANLADYEKLVADIKANVKDVIDQSYFLGELTGWGLKFVYNQPGVVDAIGAVNNAWTEKTYAAVQAAEAAIAKVGNAKSAAWLSNELANAVATVPATVTSVTAASNTKVTVTLEEPAVGQLRAADFKFDGLTVTNAVLGTSRDTVILTTSSQEAGKSYELSFRGKATNISFIGMEKDGNDVDVASAYARTNSEVQVVLNDAPLTSLSANDFNIEPSLDITSVQVNNNVVTLKTSGQVAGRTYKVSYSGSSAEFTGLSDFNATGAIDDVQVMNLRQIKVLFNKPIVWTSIDKSKFYLKMVDEVTGDIKTNRLDRITDEHWVLSEGTQKIKDDNGKLIPNVTVNYVIIESNDGSLITEDYPLPAVNDGAAILWNGLGMKYNQRTTVEARNLKDANGYINSSQDEFTVVDTAAPYVASVDNAVRLKDGQASLSLKFNEPIIDNVQRNERLDAGFFVNKDFHIYIDGIEVLQAGVVNPDLDAFIIDAPGNGKTVSNNQLVVDGKTVSIDVSNLSLGKHTIKVVGAMDLNGNVMRPNPFQATFEVKEEVYDEPASIKKAAVTKVEQIADNALEVYFDQPGVEVIDQYGKAPVVIEGAEWDDKWVNIEASTVPVVGKADLQDVKDQNAPVIEYQTYKDADGKDKTKWLVLFDAKAGRKTYENGFEVGRNKALNYDGQNSVIRNVVVQNFATELAIQHAEPYYYGNSFKKVQTFTRDTLAPTAVKVVPDVANGVLYVTFEDKIFDGEIDWNALAGDIKVSRTDKNGVTYDAFLDDATEVEVLNADNATLGLRAGRTLKLTVKNAPNTLNRLVTDTKELFRESVYTVALPQASVVDVEENIGDTDDADFIMVDMQNTTMFGGPTAPHQIKETAKSVTIPKAAAVPAVEGLVPQTTKGLIQSGVEINRNATAVDATGGADKVGTKAYMSLPENRDKVIVVFDGEVLESSALNKGNYKFNGASLPKNATVTFYTDNINNNVSVDGNVKETKDNFVIIDLPTGSVDKSGEYTFEVSNITNKSGKAMLPVSDSVALVDNTKPAALSAKVVGSRQVEVTFSELISVLDTEFAKKNFEVTVNGVTLAVNDVTVGTQRNKLILTLSQDFSLTNPKVTVRVKNDVNGNMYIVDQAVPSNVAAELRITN